MRTVTLNDKTFSLSITADEISFAVEKIARQLNRDFEGTRPLFLSILNGSFMFASDLLKKIDFYGEISFVKLASYSGTTSTENVKKLIGLNEEVRGRTVIILEDIIDSGITVDSILKQLWELGAEDVKVVSFFFKPAAFTKDFIIDYIGMSIPNDFIVGYGLDYDGLGRNLPDVYKIIGEVS